MANSLTKGVDLALKLLLYTRFANILSIDAGTDSEEDKINKGIIQEPREIALRDVSEKREEDYLEFINFWRLGTSPSWDRQRTVAARRGIWLQYVDELKTKAINVKAQPVDLTYNAWFWSKDLDKVYQCIERYIFWQQDYPKIDLTYEFDDDHSFTYSPDLHFGEIVDESTVSEKYERGVLFIYKMPIKVDAWVLDGEASRVITKMVVTFYDKDSVINYSEIVVDDSNQNVELESRLRLFRRKIYAILSYGLADNSVVVPNDRTSDFAIGDKLRIERSTSNDYVYTVTGISFVAGTTKIGLIGKSLVSCLENGNIYKVN